MSGTEKLEVGDTVELKSGGPTMTIASIETLELSGVLTAYCRWFAGEEERSGAYPCASLEKINVTGERELERED